MCPYKAKSEFDPDLVRINIRRKDFEGIKSIRQRNEPMYHLIARIWHTYNESKGVLENENRILRDMMMEWKARALEAEKHLAVQTRLDQQ